jgi:hypothetical protein
MIEREVVISSEVRVRLFWDGKRFRCQLNKNATCPMTWSVDMLDRYRSELNEFLCEVAEELRLLVWFPSGAQLVATSLAHREAAARDWFLRDTA